MALPSLLMRWEDLAFLHWRIPASLLRERVPPVFEIDTFDNTGWVGVTPFVMRGVRVHGAPPVPTTREFPELNVRTYVRHAGRAGVYFFSLDAASRLAVLAARAATNLPYHHAAMSCVRATEGFRYESRRRSGTAELRAEYRPVGDTFISRPGTLEHWLTERYSLFVLSRRGAPRRLDIQHAPWALQPGVAEIEDNTMAAAVGLTLPAEPPHVLFSRRIDVLAHWPTPA